jgi:hypothetical protein
MLRQEEMEQQTIPLLLPALSPVEGLAAKILNTSRRCASHSHYGHSNVPDATEVVPP